MNKFLEFLDKHEIGFAHSLTLVGLVFVVFQLHQSNEHKRWENYNSLNLRYYELYSKIPKELGTDSCKPFEAQAKEVKV